MSSKIMSYKCCITVSYLGKNKSILKVGLYFICDTCTFWFNIALGKNWGTTFRKCETQASTVHCAGPQNVMTQQQTFHKSLKGCFVPESLLRDFTDLPCRTDIVWYQNPSTSSSEITQNSVWQMWEVSIVFGSLRIQLDCQVFPYCYEWF